MYNEIVSILKEIRPDVNFREEKKLLSNEILDSFDVISILAVLSEKYCIEIDPDDVGEEYFDDVEGIIRLVQKIKDIK